MFMKRKKNFKDPNRKSNRMVQKEVPMSELYSERQKAYQEIKDKGGSDMAALVSAINIIPKANKRLTKKSKGSKSSELIYLCDDQNS